MEKKLSIFKKINEIFAFIITKFIIVFMSILVVSTFSQVLSRYILNKPFIWTSEVSTFSFIWVVFLGAAIGVRNSKHFSIEIIFEIFPKGHIIIFKYFSQLSILFVALILLIIGCQYSIMGLGNISPTLRIKMFYMYMSIPLSGFMMLLFTFENLYILFNRKY